MTLFTPARATRGHPSGPIERPGGRYAAADLRTLTLLPAGVLAVVVVIALSAPGLLSHWALVFAVTGVVLGVPHGAVDHLVPGWLGMTTGAAATRRLIAAYVTVALVAALALILAPAVAVLGFLLLSAAHFGTAETAFDAERRGAPTPEPWHRPLDSAAHGSVVVGLLVWARPADADPWLRLLSPAAADVLAAARPAGLLIVGGLVLTKLLMLLAGRNDRPLVEVAEVVLLVTVFAVAPPLAAFGAYFGGWHAVRHTGRLLDIARQSGDRGWRPAARRLAIASLLPTVAALGTMAALVLAGDRAPIVVEVAVLLALTYPHAAVVWSADTWRHAGRSLRGHRDDVPLVPVPTRSADSAPAATSEQPGED